MLGPLCAVVRGERIARQYGKQLQRKCGEAGQIRPASQTVDKARLAQRCKGIISPILEMTMEYAGFIGNRATGQPMMESGSGK